MKHGKFLSTLLVLAILPYLPNPPTIAMLLYLPEPLFMLE